MLDILEQEVRKELSIDIGNAVHETLVDSRASKLAEFLVGKVNSQTLTSAGLAYVMTGQSRWEKVLPESMKRIGAELNTGSVVYAPPITVLESKARQKKYPINDTYLTPTDVTDKATDLLIEAVDDSFYWFDMITGVEKADKAEHLINHPTIYSATSMTDTVNRVVKALLEEQYNRGQLSNLPKSHNDYVELFYKAPYLFAEMGLMLDVQTDDVRNPVSRGYCPARTIDSATNQSWLKELLQLTVPIYLGT